MGRCRCSMLSPIVSVVRHVVSPVPHLDVALRTRSNKPCYSQRYPPWTSTEKVDARENATVLDGSASFYRYSGCTDSSGDFHAKSPVKVGESLPKLTTCSASYRS